MTREAFERLCFGDVRWTPILSFANPDDAEHFTVSATKHYVPSADYSELYEISMDPASMYANGQPGDDFYLMFEKDMKLELTAAHDRTKRVGTIVSVDTKRGVITMRDDP